MKYRIDRVYQKYYMNHFGISAVFMLSAVGAVVDSGSRGDITERCLRKLRCRKNI